MRTPPRLLLAASLLCAAALWPAAAHARGPQPSRPFGLGVELGAPTGLAAKYYLGNRMALQMGVGVIEEWRDSDGLHLHAEMLWHPAILARTPSFTMPFYLGVGGRVLKHDRGYYDRNGNYQYDDDDTHIGVRAPIGLLMDFHNAPLDLFFELALVVDLLHDWDGDYANHHDHDSADINGAIGVRYYF